MQEGWFWGGWVRQWGWGYVGKNISEKEVIMKLQIHPYFLFSDEYYLMQNIGVAANFPLKLTQLEINYHSIFILAHFILLLFSPLIHFILVVDFELSIYFCLHVNRL